MTNYKFRGRTLRFGKNVAGDLTHFSGRSFINDDAVDDDSVEMLVGYDANGDEIYSGDILMTAEGAPLPPVKIYFGTIGRKIPLGQSIDEYTLKR